MLIDLVFVILIALAIFKGMSKGFIVAVLSFVAFMVGLAAALKLSVVVANHLRESTNVGGYWLPFLSFLIVFTGTAFLIRFIATLAKKAAGIAFLGWLDRLAGFVLYAVMYMMAYSVILFFLTKINFISFEAQTASRTYSLVEPFGPKAMSLIGRAIPLFSHMFSDLSRFFEAVSKRG